MYSTCLYCHASLGANARVEHFPVGRRLAFDGERGRLWVVCGGCGRWNLSAMEERWEAIEECERLFRGTLRRASTPNIALAQVPGALELVRVGSPLRPEMAAWRYGAQLRRRRRQDLVGAMGVIGAGGAATVGIAAGVGGGIALAGMVGALVAGVGLPLAGVAGTVAWYRRRDARPVERAEDGALIRLHHLHTLRLEGDADALTVTVASDDGPAQLSGETARTVAAAACARRNQIGARERYVLAAVDRIEGAGGASAVLSAAGRAGEIGAIRYIDRLALEMALHEETERRALEGELAALEDAWRRAEEIAAIADSLVPPLIGRQLQRLGATPD